MTSEAGDCRLVLNDKRTDARLADDNVATVVPAGTVSVDRDCAGPAGAAADRADRIQHAAAVDNVHPAVGGVADGQVSQGAPGLWTNPATTKPAAVVSPLLTSTEAVLATRRRVRLDKCVIVDPQRARTADL